VETTPNIELRQLRYFAAMVKESSIARAAARLTITRAALSRAIRVLERLVGVDLLVRLPQGVEPTPAGRVLLDAARDIELRTAAAGRKAQTRKAH
jgi:DNA-binding transcriptional LysR family regulator